MGATRDIAGVAEEEKGIYQLLQQASLAAGGEAPAQAQPSQPVFPSNSNYVQNSANFTPIRGQYQEQGHPGKALQQDIRSVLAQNSNVELSE